MKLSGLYGVVNNILYEENSSVKEKIKSDEFERLKMRLMIVMGEKYRSLIDLWPREIKTREQPPTNM